MAIVTEMPTSAWHFESGISPPSTNSLGTSRTPTDSPPVRALQSPPNPPLPRTVGFSFVNVAHPDQARGSANKRTIRSHVAKVQHSKTRESGINTTKPSSKPRARRKAPAAPFKVRPARHEVPINSPVSAVSESQSTVADRQTEHDDVEVIHRSPPGELSHFDQYRQEEHSHHGSPAAILSPHAENAAAVTLLGFDSLCGGSDDPFTSYPVPHFKGMDRMVDYYFRHIAAIDVPFVVPVGQSGLLQSKYLPLAMSEPACFYTLLLTAGTHHERVHPTSGQALGLIRLKSLAIKAMNEALLDRGRQRSDATICAVMKMASFEACFGDAHFFSAHMRGLEQLVRLRGGLSRLGQDGLLERLLLFIDANASALVGRPRHFDCEQSGSSLQHPPVVVPYADWQ